MSSAIASWIAHAAFWALLIYGGARRELKWKRIVAFLLVWLAGYFGLPYVLHGNGLFVALVAALDIALVLMIFKRDVRLV